MMNRSAFLSFPWGTTLFSCQCTSDVRNLHLSAPMQICLDRYFAMQCQKRTLISLIFPLARASVPLAAYESTPLCNDKDRLWKFSSDKFDHDHKDVVDIIFSSLVLNKAQPNQFCWLGLYMYNQQIYNNMKCDLVLVKLSRQSISLICLWSFAEASQRQSIFSHLSLNQFNFSRIFSTILDTDTRHTSIDLLN